jgi:ADP-ribose pyrophosphatase YjhB (NUDIX family)
VEKGTGKTSKRPLNREFSAGGVVYRKVKDQNSKVKTVWLVTKQTVLSKSSHPPDTWRLPKGWLDDEREAVPGPYTKGEKRTTQELIRRTALQEVREEGGVEAEIVKKIGTIKFFFHSTRGRILKFVTFYLMEWIKDLPEGFGHETSEIAWLPYEEAKKKLSYSGERRVLGEAKELLDEELQESLI